MNDDPYLANYVLVVMLGSGLLFWGFLSLASRIAGWIRNLLYSRKNKGATYE